MRCPWRAQRLRLDLDHQLECNEHRVLTPLQTPFGDLACMRYQSDIDFGVWQTVGAGRDDAATNEYLGDEWLYNAPVIEDSADQAADATPDHASLNVAFRAGAFEG